MEFNDSKWEMELNASFRFLCDVLFKDQGCVSYLKEWTPHSKSQILHYKACEFDSALQHIMV